MNTAEPPARPRSAPIFTAGLLVLVIVAYAYLLYNLVTLDKTACLGVRSETPGLAFVGASIAGLLLGRYTAGFRFLRRWDTDRETTDGKPSDTAGRIGLAVIFFALVPIFIYEAIGTYQPPNGLEPITYYVRCSIWLDVHLGSGLKAFFLILFISFLFGHWLWAWHPARLEFRGRVRAGTRQLFAELASKRLDDLPRKSVADDPASTPSREEDHGKRRSA
jgi:hypothetical protein